MRITREEVDALAASRKLVIESPKSWSSDAYDFEVFQIARAVTAGAATKRKLLQTNNVGDLCRFLGRDGITDIVGRTSSRVGPTQWHLYGQDGEFIATFKGPITLEAAKQLFP